MPTKDYYCFHADKKLIGAKIKECRKKLHLSADDLADRLMYTTKNINKWEQGKGLPRPETIVDLCNIFSVSQDDLLLPKSKYPFDYHFLDFSNDLTQTGVGDLFIFSNLYSPELEVKEKTVISNSNCFKEIEERQKKVSFDKIVNLPDEYKDFSFVFGRFDYLSQKFVFSWLTKDEDIEMSNYFYFVMAPSKYLLKQYKIDKSASYLTIKKCIRKYFDEKFGSNYKSRIESLNNDELMFEFYKLINKQFGKIEFFKDQDIKPGINAVSKIPLFVSCNELAKHTDVFVKYLNQLEKDALLTALQSFEKNDYLGLKKELEKSGSYIVKPFLKKQTLMNDDFDSFEKIYEDIIDAISSCSYEEYLDLRTKGVK